MRSMALLALALVSSIVTTSALGKGGDSAAARKKSFLGLSGLYASAGDAALGVGGAAYILLSEDVSVGVGVLLGSEDLTAASPTSGSLVTDKLTIASQFTYGYGRFFLGNSFNVLAGFGTMTGEIVLNVRDDLFDLRLDTTLSLSGMVVPFALGNHWRFGPVVFGIDWVQGFYFLSGKSEATVTSEGTSTSALQEFSDDIATLGDTLVEGNLLALGVVSVGIEF